MIRFLIRWLRRAGLLSYSPLLAVAVCPDWTSEDASRWKQFLQSPTGQSLWLRARALEAATCVNACQGKHEPKMAGGISFTLNWMEGLATISSSADAKAETIETDTQANVESRTELAYT